MEFLKTLDPDPDLGDTPDRIRNPRFGKVSGPSPEKSRCPYKKRDLDGKSPGQVRVRALLKTH